MDTARDTGGPAASGGGLVLFTPGTYLCFSIHLKSNVHLHIEQGATILAAESPKPGETTGYNGGVYDAAEPKTEWDAYQDYGHNHWHNSLIWGEDIHGMVTRTIGFNSPLQRPPPRRLVAASRDTKLCLPFRLALCQVALQFNARQGRRE